MTTAKVIVKRYGANRTIWLREDYMCGYTGVSDGYLRKVRCVFLSSVAPSHRTRELLPATGTAWRYTKIKGEFFYDYDAIPDVSPCNYRSKLPSERALLDFARQPFSINEYEALLKEHLVEMASQHITDVERYNAHAYYMTTLNGKTTFNTSLCDALIEAYSVARYVAKARLTGEYMRWGFDKMKDFDRAVCSFLADKKYPNFQVGSSPSLRRKLNELLDAERTGKGLDVFISDKYNNDNSAAVKKITVYDQETGECYQMSLHELVMYGLWNGGSAADGDLTKKKKTMLYDEYVAEMARYGYGDDAVSYRTFSHHTAKWETKLFRSFGRDGGKLHNDQHRPYLLTEGVQNPMSLWVADGTGTKMVFQHQGKMKTLYRVNIFDVASRKIVGYSVQTKLGIKVDKEEAWMFMDALKMAIETSGGKVAHELLSDNGGAFSKAEVKEACKLLFPKYRTIHPGNSQENQAETLQRLVFNYCRQYSNFVGSRMGNIKEENRTSNFEGLDIGKLPTFEEAVRQQVALIEEWNSHVGKDGLSPNNRFFGDGGENLQREDWGVKPNQTIVRRALGMRTEMHLGWMRGKLKIVQGADTYYYEIDLATNAHEINRRTGYKTDAEVMVCHDGEVADIYTADGKLICSCNAVSKAFKAQCEATEENSAGMGKQLQMRERFDGTVDAAMEELQDAKYRLPVSGEVTDYGFAVAGKSRVKEEMQEWPDELLNEDAEIAMPMRRTKVKEMTPEEMAFQDL